MDANDERFKDVLFAVPVSCSICNRFISREVEDVANQEVQDDMKRKQKDDPDWKARDWATLRKVVHKSWDK